MIGQVAALACNGEIVEEGTGRAILDNPPPLQQAPHCCRSDPRWARAVARTIVLDEPVSALDVSVQTQVLRLLAGLKTRQVLTHVYISHALQSSKRSLTRLR